MHKRIISFLLVAAMVFSLLGFSLSMSAATVVAGPVYLGADGGHGVSFNLTFPEGVESATIGVREGTDNYLVTQIFPVTNGSLSGTILGAGAINVAPNSHFLVVYPGGLYLPIAATPTTTPQPTPTPTPPGVPTVTNVTVTRPTTSDRVTIGMTTASFTANVSGNHFDGAVPQGVTWSTTHGQINEDGRLTVHNGISNNTTITITATSTFVNPDGGRVSGSIHVIARTASGGDGEGGPPRQGGGIIRPGLTTPGQPVVPGTTPPPTGEIQRDNPLFPLSDMTPAWLLYDDVSMNCWFHDFVTIVTHYGLMHGVGYRTFDPQGSMTRAMFVQVLANLEKANLGAFGGGTPAFNDIAQGDWFYPAVQWAQSVGITTGVGEGMFAPNRSVTREEMARLLNNYAKHRSIALPSNAVTPFTDVAAVSFWAADDVAAIQAAGIIGGYPDGSFGPRRTATRAEVATIFAMFVQIPGVL